MSASPPRRINRPAIVAVTAALLASVLATACAHGNPKAGNAGEWQERVRADIAEIDQAVREVYPGMVDPEARDIPGHWAEAVARAQRQAGEVRNESGLRAVLGALIQSLRDGHVGLWFASEPATVSWAGIALERRGSQYVARRPASMSGNTQAFDVRVADGARLLDCDGVAAGDLLEQQLDLWVTDWRIDANRSERASELFVDRDNPFRRMPKRCRFEMAGADPIAIKLSWQTMDTGQLKAMLAPYTRVRRERDRADLAFGAGGEAWIRVGNLTDYEQLGALRDQLASSRDRVLGAPWRVFDLRGNGGGDSSLGDALIVALWGDQALIDGEPAAPKRWRASARTLALVEGLRDQWRKDPNANPVLVGMAETISVALREATGRGDAFHTEAGTEQARSGSEAPAHTTPTFVLTDGGCFSSCIMFKHRLRRLGAIHVGDPSGRHTMYGEAWFSTTLPSGVASVSLPISINAYPRGELGGEAPHHTWTGAGDDEQGLYRWLSKLAQGGTRR